MVGRDTELKIMAALVEQAIDFHAPQLITVVGNRGTGKTRLIAEFVERHIRGRSGTRVRACRGRARKQDPRFGAVGSLLRGRFGLREAAGTEPYTPEAMAHVQRQVAEVFSQESSAAGENLTEIFHLLGGFLGLSFPPSPFLRVLRENQGQYDEMARAVLRRFFELDAEASPLVLILDDMQWADSDTLDLVRDMGAGLGGSPVIIIASTRPEMLVRCPDWGTGATEHRRIDLRSLAPAEARGMMRHLLSRAPSVPDDLVEDAVAMTGGNPHFLVQLVRLYLEHGAIRVEPTSAAAGDTGAEVWHLDAERAAEIELPITVEEAIEARIAALEWSERQLLEKGAVFGNVFWLGAVIAMTRVEVHGGITVPRSRFATKPPPVPDAFALSWTAEEEEIRQAAERGVAKLVERDYLLRLDAADSTFPGEVELVFKHNLERDLIVKSTDGGRQRQYCRLAAHWLESKQGGRSEEQLEFLAQLYERGEDTQRAAHCYLAGGDKARLRFANQEAVELYNRGLAMLPEYDALARWVALHNLGDVLERIGDTTEAITRFRDMLQLAWLFDNTAKAGAAHSRLGRMHRRRGEYHEAMEHLRQAHRLFDRADDERGIASSLDDMGQVYWLRGSYKQALEYLERGLDIRRRLRDRRSIALSMANIAHVQRDSGKFKSAISKFREALDLRRHISDLPGVAESLCDLGGVYIEDQNYDVAIGLLQEACDIAKKVGDKLAHSGALARLGVCRAATGAYDEAVGHLQTAIALAKELGNRSAEAEGLRRLAEVYRLSGDRAHAVSEAENALRISELVGARAQAGNAHRALAEALSMALGPAEDGADKQQDRAAMAEAEEQAESHFRKAIDMLGAMHNELDLARVCRAFAEFCQRNGRTAEAGDLGQRADDIYQRLRGAAAID